MTLGGAEEFPLKRHSWSWTGDGSGETGGHREEGNNISKGFCPVIQSYCLVTLSTAVSGDLLLGTESPVKSNTIEVLRKVDDTGGHEMIMVLSQTQYNRCGQLAAMTVPDRFVPEPRVSATAAVRWDLRQGKEEAGTSEQVNSLGDIVSAAGSLHAGRQ